ncbi:response regulator [Ichthyenterobacterium sp. W332]|uniref:histidine kinase n=1 Tax=Microcosmobacter mediterraneus TaxID=3075607 RepID=A0ABU2YFW8_9FLAO|nr:response regulator [Ichthyenterobacterium sp. W332]MDT0557076.1 response regulator [Ichthyenterobacterium sp. W332]
MKKILSIALICLPLLSNAQYNINKDSLKTYVEKAHALYDAGKRDSSYYYAKIVYNLAKSNQIDSIQTRIVSTLSYLEADLSKAFFYLDESELVAIKNGNCKRLAMMYQIRGARYGHNNDDKNALIHFLKLDSLLKKHHCNHFLDAMNKVNILKIFNESRSVNDTSIFPQMDRLIDNGLKISDSFKLEVPAAILYEYRANLFEERKDYKNALQNYDLALQNTYTNNNHLRQSSIYSGIAALYEKLKQQDSALVYYVKQLESMEKTVDTMQMGIANFKMAAFYSKTSKPKLAIKHVNRSLKLLDEGEYIRDEYLYEINMTLSRAHSDLGDFKTAFEASQEANRLIEAIQAKNNDENVFELEAKYETEKKEQEIKLLNSQNLLIEKQKKNQRIILLSGLTISALAALFLFFLFKSRRKVNNKLRELDTAKSRFFANISHEFRTPLTLISNPVSEAAEDETLPEEKRKQFVVAKRNSNRLLTLVNQLLDLSKIDANQLKLHIEKGELLAFIAALVDTFSYSAQQKKINYLADTKCNTIEAHFDRDAVEKIITNLVANAVKYTPNEGEIVVSSAIIDEQFLFEIKNSGSHLTQKEVDALFNRFYQTSEDNSGSGIGLALVKELVDLHKGNIEVTIPENGWIRFLVTLPVDYNTYKNETIIEASENLVFPKPNLDETNDEDEAVLPADNDEPILLVVEDNKDIRHLLKTEFKSSYNIITAANGEEGVNLAIEHVPDIIISDVMMPIKDGIALTQQLKNDVRTSHIPLVLLTAKAGDENTLLGVEVGADDYITKPFNSKLLQAKVRKLIENRRLLQERYSQELVLLPKDVAVTNVDEQFSERLQVVLDNHLVEPSFNASNFCQALGMSRMQLHRKLKALTGLTTSEFIRSQRLKLAAQLLKKSNTNVSQIGYSVGFNNPAYFSKSFKELYNCTPTQYANTN